MLEADVSARDEESDAPPALAAAGHAIEALPAAASVTFVIVNAKEAAVETVAMTAAVHVAVTLYVIVKPATAAKPHSLMLYKPP